MTTVYVNAELFARLEGVAGSREAANRHINALITQSLDMPDAVAPQPPASPLIAPAVTLHAACDILLEHIDPDQARLIRDMCLDTSRSPAEYVLSYFQLIRDRQETARVFDQERLLDDAVTAPVPRDPISQPCEFCGQPFVVVRRGQRFCPDPDDAPGCGRRAFLQALHARRPQTASRRPAELLAPPQQNLLVLQRAYAQQREVLREPAEP